MKITYLNINNLISLTEQSFYTAPGMVILNILFLILAIIYKFRDRIFQILILYACVALMYDVIAVFIAFFSPNGYYGSILIASFIQIEFGLLYVYFYTLYNKRTICQKLFTIGITFTCTSLIVFAYFICFSVTEINKVIGYFSVTSSILLVGPALYYYPTLFTEPPVKDLARDPSFWITTAILFLQALNIPIFLLDEYVSRKFPNLRQHLYSINFIAYSFLFMLFIISIFCDRIFKKNYLSNRS